jgi:hypothetical protein
MLILEKSETNIIKFGLRLTEKNMIQNLIAGGGSMVFSGRREYELVCLVM